MMKNNLPFAMKKTINLQFSADHTNLDIEPLFNPKLKAITTIEFSFPHFLRTNYRTKHNCYKLFLLQVGFGIKNTIPLFKVTTKLCRYKKLHF